MNHNDKPLSREEIKELIEEYLSDYLKKEEVEELIKSKYWKLREEEKGMWKSEKPY